MALGPNFWINNDYHPYMNYFGKNDERICMGQIRHIIAQGLYILRQQVSDSETPFSRIYLWKNDLAATGDNIETCLFCNGCSQEIASGEKITFKWSAFHCLSERLMRGDISP